MAIRFKCGTCGRVLNVKDELAGKKGKCPGCKGVIEVPLVSEEEEVPTQETSPAPAPTPAPTPEAPAPPTPAAPGAGEKSCPHCGTTIPEEAVFCVSCGTDLRTGEKMDDSPEALAAGAEEASYDFFKTAPDLILKPVETLDTIINAPPNADTFRKALILFGVGLLLFTLAIPYGHTYGEKGLFDDQGMGAKTAAFVLTFVLGVVVLFSDAIMCSVAGSMFGGRPTGFAHTFMGVLTVRALVGLAMVLALVLIFLSGMPEYAVWVVRAIRFGWGSFLLYLVIIRAYEVPPLQAIAFAIGAGALRASLFLLPSIPPFRIHLF